MDAKFTSLKEIVEKLFRDTGYTTQVDLFDAAVWAGEALDLIGAPIALEDKTATIELENHRGKMPCGWVYIKGTRDTDSHTPYRYESGTFFHTCHTSESPDLICDSYLTYKVNDNYIFASKETGSIDIAYKSHPVDDEGFPRIPDDTRFKQAIASYIQSKIDYIEYRKGKLSQALYRDSEQNWLFYVKSASTRGRMPTVDQMESFKNQVVRLIPTINEHASGFNTLGKQQQRRNN